jgi:hypothetical protein
MISKAFKVNNEGIEEIFVNINNIMYFEFDDTFLRSNGTEIRPSDLGLLLDKFVVATFVNGDRMILAMSKHYLETLRG